MKGNTAIAVEASLGRLGLAKIFAKRSVLAITGRLGLLKHGTNIFCDMRGLLPNEVFETIFDIGANIGQSAERYRIEFPRSKVYSFEPDPCTFQMLNQRFLGDARVKPLELAFGAKEAQMRFDDRLPLSVLHHLADDQTNGALPLVTVKTVDGFCAENAIERVGFMKVDTEGHDLAVLEGARRMMSESAISVILVECSMNAENTYHVGILQMHEFMERAGYRLLGLYEQTPEYSGKPVLHRTNAAYVAPLAATRNARAKK